MTISYINKDSKEHYFYYLIQGDCLEVMKKRCFTRSFPDREVKYKFIDWNTYKR